MFRAFAQQLCLETGRLLFCQWGSKYTACSADADNNLLFIDLQKHKSFFKRNSVHSTDLKGKQKESVCLVRVDRNGSETAESGPFQSRIVNTRL